MDPPTQELTYFKNINKLNGTDPISANPVKASPFSGCAPAGHGVAQYEVSGKLAPEDMTQYSSCEHKSIIRYIHKYESVFTIPILKLPGNLFRGTEAAIIKIAPFRLFI